MKSSHPPCEHSFHAVITVSLLVPPSTSWRTLHQLSMMAAAGIDSSMYDTLKHQVQRLKLEQQSLAGQRSKQKEVTPGSHPHLSS